VRIPIAEIVFG